MGITSGTQSFMSYVRPNSTQAGNLIGLPWDDLFNVLENPDQLSPEWMQRNEATLKRQLQILCGTLQVETSFLKISQVALSVDEATFAVGQLVAYEPKAVSELPLANEIITSLARSLERGWQIHHGVGKFAANALTVLVTCKTAKKEIRIKACHLLLFALAGWLKDFKRSNDVVEEVCGCHCRRASTAACCFLDRVFARPDDLLKEQVAKFPKLIEMITDLQMVVRDEYGCPFSLTSLLQVPGVMKAVMESTQPVSHVLDNAPVRLAEACMACLSYAILTVDDHFFTDQSVRCFLEFAEYGDGDGFQRLMSHPISLFMLEGLFTAACCLPAATTLVKKIASHPVTIRCVLSFLLAICTPKISAHAHHNARSSRIKQQQGETKTNKNKGDTEADHRRQATLHLKVMALADTLHPKIQPRGKSCLLVDSMFSKSKILAKNRCRNGSNTPKDKKERLGLGGLSPGDRRACLMKTLGSRNKEIKNSRSFDQGMELKGAAKELKNAALNFGGLSGNTLSFDEKTTTFVGASQREESTQISKLRDDIEKLKMEIKQMRTNSDLSISRPRSPSRSRNNNKKNNNNNNDNDNSKSKDNTSNDSSGSGTQTGTGTQNNNNSAGVTANLGLDLSSLTQQQNSSNDVKEDPNSWRYFKTRSVSKVDGETCTSLSLSSQPGIPRWPNKHVSRDPAIGWLVIEILVGEEKAREVVKGRLSLVEVCKWLQRQLFCIHQGGQDPHEEEPLVFIECDRKGDAIAELRVSMRDKVGIFGDISGQIEMQFKNESANGPAVLREWFVHASQFFALPEKNLLVSRDNGVTMFPSPSSHLTSPDDYLGDFKILGRLVGLGIFKRVPSALRFSKQFCKLVLNNGKLYDWTYEDIKELDPMLYKLKVKYILENPVEDLDLYFEDVLDDRSASDFRVAGSDEQVELKENGGKIKVTDENKEEYVKLMCEWRLYGSIRKQTEAFLSGIHTLITEEMFKGLNAVLSPTGFANMIAGLPTVDAEDWERHSRCSGGYTPNDEQVKWFWEVVNEFNMPNRAALLHFVTGSRNPPIGGFARLQGFNGDQKFTISKISASIDSLPSAHACICTIDLPMYTSKDMLRERIVKAISMGGIGFNGNENEDL